MDLYDVVFAEKLSDLVFIVNEKMQQGWKLVGGCFIGRNSNYCQTLLLPAPK